MTFLNWLLPKLAQSQSENKPSPEIDFRHDPISPAPLKRDFTGKSLGEKQRMFTLMIAELIQWAYSEMGYELSVGDFFRDPRVHGDIGKKVGYSAANSVHKLKLAADLNLFIDGKYQESTEAHRVLGERWEAMGGSWGGRFNDGNHYSIPHGGYK